MDFAALSGYLPAIEKAIARSYAVERRNARPPFRPYLDVVSEFTLRGGKRFRGLLVLAGFHIASRRRPDPALPAAIALEHFQSWMLIHDDIIDHAEQRRGGPTVHRTLARRHTSERGVSDAEGYGVGLGITLGDLLEPFTVGALLEARLPPATRLRALSEYVRMARRTAYGQLLDIQNGGRQVELVTEADVLLVHELKSAAYTVTSPLRIGATLGGATPGLLQELEAIGTDFGVAFQLRDDVLGAGFDSRASGKSANDLVEGKRTLLVVKAWQLSDRRGRAALERVLGRPGAPQKGVEAARNLIRSSGSLEYSEQRISQLSERAARRIEQSRRLSRGSKRLLREIGEKLVRRRT